MMYGVFSVFFLSFLFKGVRRRCTVNLIDDGVVIDNISRDVTVTFRLTEQDGVDPSMVTIRCTLSGPTPMGTNICKLCAAQFIQNRQRTNVVWTSLYDLELLLALGN